MHVYELTEQQYNDINNAFPQGIIVSYEDGGKYLLNDSILNYVDLETIIDDLYSKTVENFLATLTLNDDLLTIEEFKIGQYSAKAYKDLHYSSFVFNRMLKTEIATNKSVFMLPSGRPEKSEYKINDEIVATINFTFTDDSNTGLLQERKKELIYIDTDGNEGPVILIESKQYDLTNTSTLDNVLVMRERELSRKNIIEDIKGIIAGVLMMALGKTIEEVTAIVSPFWNDCSNEIYLYESLGAQDWKNTIASIDVDTTPYTFVAIEIAPGFTVKDYVLGRLS